MDTIRKINPQIIDALRTILRFIPLIIEGSEDFPAELIRGCRIARHKTIKEARADAHVGKTRLEQMIGAVYRRTNWLCMFLATRPEIERAILTELPGRNWPWAWYDDSFTSKLNKAVWSGDDEVLEQELDKLLSEPFSAKIIANVLRESRDRIDSLERANVKLDTESQERSKQIELASKLLGDGDFCQLVQRLLDENAEKMRQDKLAAELDAAHTQALSENTPGRRWLTTEIIDIDLSVGAFNCLNKAGVETLGDLCEWSEAKLLQLRNFGYARLQEVKAKLAEFELELRPYEDN